MAHLSSLLSVLLVIVTIFGVSATTVTYNVTRTSCAIGVTCPPGNTNGQIFVLNGVQVPDLQLNKGDTLTLTLQVNSANHPLTICQNSSPPLFCHNAAGSNLLNIPITTLGDTTSFTFTTDGTYYYGCLRHDAMGAIITVTTKGD